jgi:type VI secretion system protein ImpG
MGIPQDPTPEHADAFARAFPALADRLAQPGDDPDVERLFEGFTALARRVDRVIDATSLRSVLHFAEILSPEVLRPFPCATILELASRKGVRESVDAGAEFDSVAVDGGRCRFRAHAPFTYVPWRVADAKLAWTQSRGQSLDIGLAPIGTLRPGQASAPLPLRLHLTGEPRSALLLLAWLHEHLVDAELDINGSTTALGADAVRAWGLGREEALLPIEPLEHPGIRLLRELMILPAKFAFVDVSGPALASTDLAGRVAIRFRFDAAMPAGVRVDGESIRTNCVPVINAFATSADPVRPSLERPVQPVRPAGLRPQHAEVYAVREAIALCTNGDRLPVSPVTDFGAAPTDSRGMLYALERVPSRSGPGVDVSIAAASSAEVNVEPTIDVLSIDLWATNRALPMSLGVGDVRVAAPLSPRGLTFRNVRAVTPYRAAAHGEALVWRTLALGALSARTLAHRDSICTLLHALDLHALADAQAARAHAQRLEAIVGIETRPVVERLGGSVVRGHDVHVRLAEGSFDGEGEAFLFGQVLARLFAHEASLNSFVRTTVHLVTTGRQFRLPALHGDRTIG